jgi:hypothetical protein
MAIAYVDSITVPGDAAAEQVALEFEIELVRAVSPIEIRFEGCGEPVASPIQFGGGSPILISIRGACVSRCFSETAAAPGVAVADKKPAKNKGRRFFSGGPLPSRRECRPSELYPSNVSRTLLHVLQLSSAAPARCSWALHS